MLFFIFQRARTCFTMKLSCVLRYHSHLFAYFRPLSKLFQCKKKCNRQSLLCNSLCREIRTSPVASFLDVRDKDHHEKEKQLVVYQNQIFDEAAKKARDKETFIEAIGRYLKHNAVYRRGHVEFIYAALGRVKEFNAHTDLDTYKHLLDLFPKGTMVAQTTWQVEMMHYPKQQQCCIDILDAMEDHGIFIL